ncbi:MAG: hypothetical protein Q9174_004589, partial [Haloplaca sp. 1 TL-2023]
MGCFVVDEELVGSKPLQDDIPGDFDCDKPLANRKGLARNASALPPDADSTTDDAISLGGSVPLSLSTTMHQMVDDLAGSEGSNGRPHPASKPFALSGIPAKTLAGANDTSYPAGDSTISALTAMDFVNQIRSRPSSRQAQEPLQPSNPRTGNPPSALRPAEESVLSASPKHSSGNPISLSDPISSMSDPTQASYLPNVHPSLRNRAAGNRHDH